MQPPESYTEAFEREHGCTLADWLRSLPDAVGANALALGQDGHATVAIGRGTLALHWQVLPPRQIALVRMPRLQVSYRFSDVAQAERVAFMRLFDLTMQRGGG